VAWRHGDRLIFESSCRRLGYLWQQGMNTYAKTADSRTLLFYVCMLMVVDCPCLLLLSLYVPSEVDASVCTPLCAANSLRHQTLEGLQPRPSEHSAGHLSLVMPVL
jgi:hypothetical protein